MLVFFWGNIKPTKWACTCENTLYKNDACSVENNSFHVYMCAAVDGSEKVNTEIILCISSWTMCNWSAKSQRDFENCIEYRLKHFSSFSNDTFNFHIILFLKMYHRDMHMWGNKINQIPNRRGLGLSYEELQLSRIDWQFCSIQSQTYKFLYL